MAKQDDIQIGVVLKPNDVRRWLNALDRIGTEADRQALEVPRLQSVDYMSLLINNIMNGRHPHYKEYHPRYAAWKGGGSFWRLFGDLSRAITYRRIESSGEYAWFAGVPAGVMDSGGKSWFGWGNRGPAKEIAWYGGIMEGTIKTTKQKHPARPIFEPTRKQYLSSADPFVKASIGLYRVAEKWR